MLKIKGWNKCLEESGWLDGDYSGHGEGEDERAQNEPEKRFVSGHKGVYRKTFWLDIKESIETFRPVTKKGIYEIPNRLSLTKS